MAPLSPLSEEPVSEDDSTKRSRSFRTWVRNHFPLLSSHHKSNLRLLLSVLACPLSPVPVLPRPPRKVASSAQYIIQQFRATTGCAKMERGGIKSMYAAGRVRLAVSSHQTGKRPAPSSSPILPGHSGCFVLWQLVPDMWIVELAAAGHQIAAGSDGHVAWRRTPWLRPHAARGGVRPLRRLLQGLDPVTIAAVFSPAHHVGEKHVGDEECFVLKLDVGDSVLRCWSDGGAEIIKHGMVGYFSQRSGLLVRLDDSQLTRIQQGPGAEATYWETTISSCMGDYRAVGSVAVAHSGRSTASLVRFGVGLKADRVLTQMEEVWAIDDVEFNVPGLSADGFIPPAEAQSSRLYDLASM